MAETVKNIKIDDKDFIQTTMDNGTVVTVPKPGPIIPKPDPAYKVLLDKEDTSKIKTGVLTPAEQQKLLAAIALKLGVLT